MERIKNIEQVKKRDSIGFDFGVSLGLHKRLKLFNLRVWRRSVSFNFERCDGAMVGTECHLN